MTIDVSVIITTYNVESYIGRTVNSVLAQAGVTFEIVIVDDCSTDGTWQIVSALADPRIARVQLKKNGGPSVARNAGIAIAQGRWLAVLDGDDMFLPGRLVRCLERAQKANADIVVDNIEISREVDGKTFPMFPDAEFSRFKTLELPRFIEGNLLFAQGYSLGYLKPVFSAEFLRKQKLAYDPALRIGEDYLLLAEALAQGAVCAVEPVAGYSYTVRAGSISHRLSLSDINRMSALDSIFLQRYALDPSGQKAQRRRTRSLQEAAGYTKLIDALKLKNPAAAIKAMLYCPMAIRQLWRPVASRISRLRQTGSQSPQ